MLRYLMLLLLSFVVKSSLWAQTAEIEARLSRTAMRIGEQVQLEMRVRCAPRQSVKFPEGLSGQLVKGLEIVASSAVDTTLAKDGATHVLTKRYTLTAFDTAVYRMDSLRFQINGRSQFAPHPLVLKVEGVRTDQRHPDQLRPAHGIVMGEWAWSAEIPLLCVALILSLYLLVFAVVKLSMGQPLLRRVTIVPPPQPYKVALRALAQLRAAPLATQMDAAAYFTSMTDVLRAYWSARYAFAAKEMTTAEILHALREQDETIHADELRAWLGLADLAKFAQDACSAEMCERALDWAEHHVEQTKIDQPEAELPRVEAVPYAARVQRWYRGAWMACAVLTALALPVLGAYIVVLLYLSFA